MIYFTPFTRVLFTFPSRYLFTIGRQSVFSLTGWSRQIHTGFPVPRITWDTPGVQRISFTGLSPSMVCLSRPLQLPSSHPMMESRYPFATCVVKVWAVPRSLAATKGITVLFYFPPGTKMFQFPGLPRPVLFYSDGRHHLIDWGGEVAPFGHPRILARNGFPWHFAVYCVLHRLLAPRYPPCALRSLTNVWLILCGRTPQQFSRQIYWWNTDLNM
jgi:hypothetical protein